MKWTILMLAMLLLAGCGAAGARGEPGAPAEAPAESRLPAETAETALWTRDDLPAAVRYDRRWAYSAAAESEDPETIAALVAAIRALRPGAVSELYAEDYTDLLTFTFADGSTLCLEFEAGNTVYPDGTRRETEGLPRLRALLDELIETPDA